MIKENKHTVTNMADAASYGSVVEEEKGIMAVLETCLGAPIKRI